jgi:hypothetical protein
VPGKTDYRSVCEKPTISLASLLLLVDPNPDARPSAAVGRLLGQAPEKLIVFSVNTIEEGDAPDDTV